MFKRLAKLSDEAKFPISCEAEDTLNMLDELMTSLMLEAEKKYWKIYACHHDFSLEVKGWLDRCHAYW